MGEASSFGRLPLCLGCITRRSGGRARGVLEYPDGVISSVCSCLLGLSELGAQPCLEARRGFAPKADPLGGTLKAIERGQRRLPASGRIRELILGLLALSQQGGESLLGAPAGDRNRIPARLGVCTTLGDGREIELCDPSPETGNLDRELLGAFSGGCLQGQRPKPLSHVVLDVARPFDLGGNAGELEFGPVLAPLELAESRGLLDEMAPVFRPGGEYRVDLPL